LSNYPFFFAELPELLDEELGAISQRQVLIKVLIISLKNIQTQHFVSTKLANTYWFPMGL